MAKHPALTERDLVQPVEAPSAIRKAGNMALGGISMFGNLLDLPGSVVRDVLSLRNPLDQFLTPLSPDNRATGGDMLRSLGVIGKEDTWGNLPARLAFEFALDPMTYLTFGTGSALTAAGKAAKKIGTLGLAADVATARAAAKGATEVAPLATKALLESSQAMTPKIGSTALEEAAKAGIARSLPATASVGPRMAKKTLTLKELMAGLPDGAKGATSVTSEVAMKNLDDYAKKLKYADAAEFLARHGDEALAMDAKIGFPFTRAETLFNLGRTGDSIARHLDLAGHYARWSLPGRAIGMLFGSSNLDQLSRTGQELGSAITDRRRRLEMKAAKTSYDAIQELESIVPDFNKVYGGAGLHLPNRSAAEFTIDSLDAARQALGRIYRFAAELTETQAVDKGFKNSLHRAAATMLPGSNVTELSSGPMADKIMDLIGKVREAKDLARADFVDGGGKAGLIDFDWLSHHPRYAVPKNFTEDFAFRSRLAPSEGVATMSREKALAALPAEVIHSVLADPFARHGRMPKEVADLLKAVKAQTGMAPPSPTIGKARIKEMIQDWTGDIDIDLPDGTVKKITVDDQADQLFDYVKKSSEDFLQDRRMYPNAPMEDAAKHLTSMHRLIATRDAVYTTLLRSVDDMDKMPGYQGPTVTIRETLEKAGYDADKAAARMGKMAGATDPAFSATMLDRAVPKELYDAVTSINTKSSSPRWAQATGFYWDKMTRVLKENLTLPFPAFWVRNFFSGQMMNMMANHVGTPGDLKEYFEQFKFADAIRKNPEAHNDLMRELHAMDVYRYGYHSADIPEHVKLSNVSPLPVFDYPGVRRAAKDVVAERGETMIESALGRFPKATEIASKAIVPLREAHQTVLESGRRISAMGEWYNRVPMYLYLRKQGYAPEVASQIVKDIHVDYSDLTGFEKSGMRRVALFYTFSRKQLEQTAKRIFEQPGGVPGLSIAATIKAVNRARDPGELLPDYVAETASIPLNTDEQGNRSYLTGLGLAFEDPLQFFGKGLRGAGTELLSRTNPLIKGPLEYFTGELFFQSGPMGGRDLPDADPLLGRTLANITGRDVPYKIPELAEVAIANSPLSRVVSTTRQLFDPRKSLLESATNLTTGLRTSIVSPAASDAILRERVNEQLRQSGAKQFVRTYIPEPYKAHMSKGELSEATELTDTMNELARRTKARKKLKEAAAKAGA